MRKGLTVAIVLLAVALVLFLHSKKRAADTTVPTQAFSTGQPENPSAPENNNNSGPTPASSSAGTNPALPAPSSPSPVPENMTDRAGAVPPAPATPAADVPPEIVVQNVRRAILQYGAMFGGNPVGTNPEITAQLNGGNPKGIKFINPEAGMRINGNGELVDSWGTPLFFHQLSAADTEVRSAGPDKRMWTGDDLVAR